MCLVYKLRCFKLLVDYITKKDIQIRFIIYNIINYSIFIVIVGRLI